MLEPGLSAVLTLRPDGSQPRWLGQLGHVGSLKYSYSLPGGSDQLSCTLAVPADYRTDALNPGRIVQVVRGGRVIWDGKLDEPAPPSGTSSAGWSLTAHGCGTFGADFSAIWTSAWGSSGSQNDAVNQAIGRGLRWVNPGISSSGIWFGQVTDSGSQQISDLLNLFCTKGGLTWYVTVTPAGNILSVFPLPTAPNRTLVAPSPVARTLGGDINVIWLRYQSSADGNKTAVYSVTSVSTAASVSAHGPIEAFTDISSAGNMTAGQAQAAGNAILARYQRASFAGPFTVRYGELLTLGGQPVDIGCEQAGTVCKAVLTDYGYGGEVVPDPVTFLVGGYEYDDDAQSANITPFQYLDLSVTNLLGMLSTTIGVRRPWPRHSTGTPVTWLGPPHSTGRPEHRAGHHHHHRHHKR